MDADFISTLGKITLKKGKQFWRVGEKVQIIHSSSTEFQ